MPTTTSINLNALATNLGNYCQDFNSQIFSQALIGLEKLTEGNGITILESITDEMPLINFSVGNMIQPYDNKSFNNVANTLGFNSRTLKARRYKVDLLIHPEDFRNQWLAHNRPTRGMMKEITDMPYHEFIMMKLMEKVGLELFWAAWGGVYSAPVIGTPNPAATWVDVLDGFIKLLQTEVTANAVPVVTTGALTSSNIVAKLEAVGNQLGGVTTDGTGVMFVSRAAYRLYAQSDNTVGRFIGFRELDAPITLRGTGIKVIECPALDKAGKPHAVIATTMNNMFMGTDVLDSKNKIEIQKYERSIKVLIDGTWGSQIALVDKVNNPIVVNDQL